MQEEMIEPVMQQSQLMWYYSALGIKYATLLPLSGLFSFVTAILLAIRGRGAARVGASMFLVALPMLVGLFGTVEGIMYVCQVVGMSRTQTPSTSDFAEGISTALVTLYIGMLLASPTFAIATFSLLARAFTEPEAPANYAQSGSAFPPPGK